MGRPVCFEVFEKPYDRIESAVDGIDFLLTLSPKNPRDSQSVVMINEMRFFAQKGHSTHY